MIDEKILDQILPVPDQAQERDEIVTELQDEGFVITNFSSGGIWYTILMIFIRIEIEITRLARNILNNMYATHATGGWLGLKGRDFSKIPKAATRTMGKVILERTEPGDAVKIPKGHVFKTEKDINGDELRFFALEAAILQQGALSVAVPVQAEAEGAKYNVPPGQITRSLTHIEGGVITITNKEDWITSEGSDEEEEEAFRRRLLRAWTELATIAIRDKVENIAEGVPGVLYARAKDMHPRGQGTFDLIITGTAGEATAELLGKVREAVLPVLRPDDDLEVRSSTTAMEDLVIDATIPSNMSEEGLTERITAIVTDLMQLTKRKNLNTLYHADLVYAIKKDIPALQNVRIARPETDLILDVEMVIRLGTVTVNVQQEAV